MTTIQISSYFLTTSLKPKAAQEKLREIIFDYIDQSDIGDGFNLDLFIEDLVNQEEAVFSCIDTDLVDNIDVEITDEMVDDIIQDYIELHDTDSPDYDIDEDIDEDYESDDSSYEGEDFHPDEDED